MPRNFDPKIAWKLHISASVAGPIEYYLKDPLAARPVYGARTMLVEALLVRWLAEQTRQPTDDRPLPGVPTLEQLRSSNRG